MFAGGVLMICVDLAIDRAGRGGAQSLGGGDAGDGWRIRTTRSGHPLGSDHPSAIRSGTRRTSSPRSTRAASSCPMRRKAARDDRHHRPRRAPVAGAAPGRPVVEADGDRGGAGQRLHPDHLPPLLAGAGGRGGDASGWYCGGCGPDSRGSEKDEKPIGHGMTLPIYISGASASGWWAMFITMLADMTAFAGLRLAITSSGPGTRTSRRGTGHGRAGDVLADARAGADVGELGDDGGGARDRCAWSRSVWRGCWAPAPS
ncbi:hypothetical protein AB5I41_24630 [Sphingomonas sp. MMS24-JH45]